MERLLRTDDLVIPQGVDHRIQWPLRGADGSFVPVEGWTARAQVRKEIADSEPLVEWTTENGSLVLLDSSLTLVITASESAAWTWLFGVYDIEVVSATGEVTRLTQGNVSISPEVTR